MMGLCRGGAWEGCGWFPIKRIGLIQQAGGLTGTAVPLSFCRVWRTIKFRAKGIHGSRWRAMPDYRGGIDAGAPFVPNLGQYVICCQRRTRRGRRRAVMRHGDAGTSAFTRRRCATRCPPTARRCRVPALWIVRYVLMDDAVLHSTAFSASSGLG